MKNKAIELTTFKLNNFTVQQFIVANQEIDDFLKKQKGFVSRSIFELKKGIIYDLLVWENVDDGTIAMHKLMSELSDSVVHDMIDQSTVSWNISSIEHFVDLFKEDL
jgi:hypothetical protein